MVKRSVAGWTIVVIAIVAVLTNIIGTAAAERGWRSYVLLIQNGSMQQATITKTDSGSNGPAQYAFTVGGRSYYGTAPNCRAQVGQSVAVTYLAEDPSTSCLGSPGARLADEMVAFLFGGLSFPDQP